MRPRQYIMAVLLAAMLLALAAPPLGAATRQSTQAELRALRARIEAMSRQGSLDAAERERLTAKLRAAELFLGQARDQLEGTEHDIADHSARRAALATARAGQVRSLAAARAGLAGELRAAYLLGREGPLKLLINQKSPLANGRLLTYYGYFSRAAAARIGRIQNALRQLDALDVELAQQQSALAALRQSQHSQLRQLSQARDQRQQVLVGLTSRARTRAQQLAQLESQQADLEQLLRQLGHARGPALPPDRATAFGRLHGQLPWPVSGRITARYGQQRASGVTWDGLLIATRRDAPVHAVSAGQVVYADWLPGLGLLVIINHGEGYLSLYGHNDRLFKAVGATVAEGEVIAAAGDTGGRADPQLYFEIRRDGKPVDPGPWFRAPAPPSL